MSIKQIAPQVYVQDGYFGVTVGCLVSGAGVLCVDCPTLPSDARDWRAQIGRITDFPVRFLALTDAHRDRIVGLPHLGGTVIAHEAAWDKMKGYNEAVRQQVAESLLQRQPGASDVTPEWRLVLPQITFTYQLGLYEMGAPVIIQHVGGGLPGSSWVHLPEQNVLFMGNLLVSRGHPVTAEADIPAWIEALEWVQSSDFPANITIIPGQGGLCSKSDLARMIDYLKTMRARVQALVRSRKAKADTFPIVAELFPYFPVPGGERERDCMQRRIKVGLDHIYDTLKTKK